MKVHLEGEHIERVQLLSAKVEIRWEDEKKGWSKRRLEVDGVTRFHLMRESLKTGVDHLISDANPSSSHSLFSESFAVEKLKAFPINLSNHIIIT